MSYQYRDMDILIVIYIFNAVLIFIVNADLRSRPLSDFFFLLVAAEVISDAVEIIIEVSTNVAVFFVIKDFFILVFDLLEAGDVSEIEV
jgi:hypothetical protein